MKKIIPALAVVLVGAAAAGYWLNKNTDLPTLSDLAQPQIDASTMPAGTNTSAVQGSDVMPYEPQYTEVDGHKVYYVSGGTSDDNSAMIFLHGNPTQSYMWRHTLPLIEDVSAFYAFDWPGYGYSDKPNPPLGYDDYYKILSDFIDQQNLEKVILVIHDWSGLVAFHYAAEHPDRIKGIVFMETLVPPIMPMKEYSDLGNVGQFFKNIRDEKFKHDMIIEGNGFVDLFVQTASKDGLTPTEIKVYTQPFADEQNRNVLLVFPNLLPIGGKPEKMDKLVNDYGQWFLNSHDVPKLFLYGNPGLFTPPSFVEYYKEHTPEVDAAEVGMGYHYLPVDYGDVIGHKIRDWYMKTYK